jgi:hypothetical protein
MIEAANPWEWWAVYATNIVFQGYFAGQTYEEAAAKFGLLGKVFQFVTGWNDDCHNQS